MKPIRAYVVQCLESYCRTVREIELLQCELTALCFVSEDEVLESMVFAKGNSEVQGSKGHVSDKTASVAMCYRDFTAKINNDARTSVINQLLPLKAKKDRLDRCIMFLSAINNKVITGLYVQERAVKDLALELHVSERTVQRYRDNAVDELVSMYEILEQVGIALD